MVVDGAARDDALHAILLRFAGLGSYPRARRQRRRDGEGDGPCLTRGSAFPDSPQCNDRGNWKEHRQDDREVHHQRMERDAEHSGCLEE